MHLSKPREGLLMTIHTCHACGAALPDSANFCGVCGQALDSVANAEKEASLPQAPVRADSLQKADALSSSPTNQLVNQVSKAGLAGRSSVHGERGAGPSAEAGPTKPVLDWSNIAHVGGGAPTEPVMHNPFAIPPAIVTPQP